jgi:hypothetical protein
VTRLRTALLLAPLILAAAPAAALAGGPAWTSVAGIPSSVNLAAVASAGSGSGDVVIAVGQDTSNHQAVVYRYSSSGWQADSLPSPVPSDSCLTAVAVDANGAWAVGSQGGGCGAKDTKPGSPFVLSYTNTNATWTDQSKSYPGAGLPTAVALDGDGGGFIGDQTGGIYRLTDSPAAISKVPTVPTQPSAITGIALTPSSGFVVGSPSSSGNSIFGITASNSTATVLTPAATAGLPSGRGPVAAISGASPSSPPSAITLDAADVGWWELDNGAVWAPGTQSLPGSPKRLSAVAMTGDASSPVSVIAGSNSFNQGAVWTRTGSGAFTGQAVSCQPLNGVTAIAADDVWAVGDQGTVVHYSVSAGTPAGCGSGSTSQNGGTSTGTGSVGSNGSTVNYDSPPGNQGSGGSGSGNSSGVQVTVSQPPPGSSRPTPSKPPQHGGGKPKPKPHRGLLVRNVRVRVERGRLVVTCTLSGPARVSAVASLAGRVVGRTGWHQFRSGRCQLVVPYSGPRPPGALRIVARPLSGLAGDPRRARRKLQ